MDGTTVRIVPSVLESLDSSSVRSQGGHFHDVADHSKSLVVEFTIAPCGYTLHIIGKKRKKKRINVCASK